MEQLHSRYKGTNIYRTRPSGMYKATVTKGQPYDYGFSVTPLLADTLAGIKKLIRES